MGHFGSVTQAMRDVPSIGIKAIICSALPKKLKNFAKVDTAIVDENTGEDAPVLDQDGWATYETDDLLSDQDPPEDNRAIGLSEVAFRQGRSFKEVAAVISIHISKHTQT